ncbi:MAG: molybdopterin molybdotransferase MoeA, partial [Clostridiales bacterium]
YNSNAYCLAGYCQQLGAQTIISTIAKDTIEAICQSLEDALAKADLLITTGGVSVGDYDLVAECLQTIGADFLYEGVGMKPGKPSLAGIKDDKIILSLSGNPAAAMTAFLMLGQPLIKKMTGLTNIQHLKIKALMMDDFPKKSIQRRFLRGQVKIEDNQAKVYLTGSQRNSVLMSMVDCNALIDIPAGNQGIEKGCLLDVYLTDNL